MSRSRSERGYTAVELLMAITIFAIGVSGIFAMQKVALTSNQHARSVAIATHIGQAWLENLSSDAGAWNHPSPNNTASDLVADTQWLNKAFTNPSEWLRPVYSADRQFGAPFDGLGNPLPEANADDAVYCAHVRLTWLYPESAGNGLIRAEVRVFWLRSNAGGTVDAKPICDATSDVALIEDAIEKYHFVYQTTAIRQNTAP